MIPVTIDPQQHVQLDDILEDQPLQTPLQTAIEQLNHLNELYATRKELRNRVWSRDLSFIWTLHASICGVLAGIAIIIWVPVRIHQFLNCQQPSYDCLLAFDCIENYQWCLPIQDIGGLLWQYYNDNTQGWGIDIYNEILENNFYDIDPKQLFLYGLVSTCNTTTGSSINFPMQFNESTKLILAGLGVTVGAHVLSQLFTWAIERAGLKVPCLSFREFLSLHRNIAVAQQNEENYHNALINDHENSAYESHHDLIVASNLPFQKQTRRYLRNLSAISLFCMQIIMYTGWWLTILQIINTSVNVFESNPFRFEKYPSQCSPDTYGVGYSFNYFTPIPGGMEYVMEAPATAHDDLHAQVVYPFAVGFFTSLIAPGIAFLKNLAFASLNGRQWIHFHRTQN